VGLGTGAAVGIILLVGAGVNLVARDLAFTPSTFSTLTASTTSTVSSPEVFTQSSKEAEPDERVRKATAANKRRVIDPVA